MSCFFMKSGDVTGMKTDMEKAVAMRTFADNGNSLSSHFKGLYGRNVGIVTNRNFRNRDSL
jgi:hypothetical protein